MCLKTSQEPIQTSLHRLLAYPFRTAVASATVAGMMKKELADTASWKRLI